MNIKSNQDFILGYIVGSAGWEAAELLGQIPDNVKVTPVKHPLDAQVPVYAATFFNPKIVSRERAHEFRYSATREQATNEELSNMGILYYTMEQQDEEE